MENSIEEDEDKGMMVFNLDMTVDDFLDQYIVWRLTDILRYESDPRVRRACHELKAYMKTPEIPND